jgi:hypothetical protein
MDIVLVDWTTMVWKFHVKECTQMIMAIQRQKKLLMCERAVPIGGCHLIPGLPMLCHLLWLHHLLHIHHLLRIHQLLPLRLMMFQLAVVRMGMTPWNMIKTMQWIMTLDPLHLQLAGSFRSYLIVSWMTFSWRL